VKRSAAVSRPVTPAGDRPSAGTSALDRVTRSRPQRRRYRAQVADAAAFRRAQRPKPAKLVTEPRLRAVVEATLALRWSPQQIAGWLRVAYPDEPSMRTSHETIYHSLYVPHRGALHRDLRRCLRIGRATRHPRGKRLPQGRGQLLDTIPISQWPAEADQRTVPGHWEATWCWASALGRAHAGRAD
jgi:IS30 family transposase